MDQVLQREVQNVRHVQGIVSTLVLYVITGHHTVPEPAAGWPGEDVGGNAGRDAEHWLMPPECVFQHAQWK